MWRLLKLPLSDHGRRKKSTFLKTKKAVKNKYTQAYRKAWEDDPLFKDWLTQCPLNKEKAYCMLCERTLLPHRLSLMKHTLSLRHTKLSQPIEYVIEPNEENVPSPLPEPAENECAIVKVEEVLEKDPNEIDVLNPVEQIVGNKKSVHEEEEEAPSLPKSPVGLFRHPNSPSNSDLNSFSEYLDDPSSPHNIHVVEPPAKKTPKPPITTHVLDTTVGLPACGMSVSLSNYIDGQWSEIKQSITNEDGRCNALTSPGSIRPGRYKLHFETESYFMLRQQPTFYPYVEVIFDVISAQEHHHVPLLLSPFGYSTYRGS